MVVPVYLQPRPTTLLARSSTTRALLPVAILQQTSFLEPPFSGLCDASFLSLHWCCSRQHTFDNAMTHSA